MAGIVGGKSLIMPVRTNIEAEAFGDIRFATLARLRKFADSDHALIKCAKIWSWQTEHYTDEAPTYVVDRDLIETVMGEGGAEDMVRAKLAEETPDGFRIKGGIDNRGKSRIDWLWRKKQEGKRASDAAAEKRNRGHQSAPSSALSSADSRADSSAGLERKQDNKEVQRWTGHLTTDPSGDLTPLSSSLLDQRSEISLAPAPAIPPSTDSGGMWAMSKRAWDYQRERHRAIRDRGIKPNASDLPRMFAGQLEANLFECIRFLRGCGFSDEEAEVKLRNAVDVVEAECERDGHLDWFNPALIWDPKRFPRSITDSPSSVRERKRDGPTKTGKRDTRTDREILQDAFRKSPDQHGNR